MPLLSGLLGLVLVLVLVSDHSIQGDHWHSAMAANANGAMANAMTKQVALKAHTDTQQQSSKLVFQAAETAAAVPTSGKVNIDSAPDLTTPVLAKPTVAAWVAETARTTGPDDNTHRGNVNTNIDSGSNNNTTNATTTTTSTVGSNTGDSKGAFSNTTTSTRHDAKPPSSSSGTAIKNKINNNFINNNVNAMSDYHVDEPTVVISDIIYINLDERRDRMEAMETALRQRAKTIRHRRLRATKTTLGAALSDNRLSAFIGNNRIRDPSPTSRLDFTISVKLSHMQAWQQVLDLVNVTSKVNPVVASPSSDPATLILEDDVNIHPYWEERVRRGLSHVPAGWEIVRVDVWYNVNPADLVWTDGDVSVYAAATDSDWSWYADAGCPDCDNIPENHHGIYYYGAQAVLVQPSTVASLIDKFKQSPIADIDSLMVSGGQQGISDLKSYVIQADVLNPGEISMQSDHPQEWT